MDDFDMFASQPSAAPASNLFDLGNTNQTTNNQNDDSSWLVENNADTTTSFQPNALADNAFTASSQTPVFQSDDIFNNAAPTSMPAFQSDDIFNNVAPTSTFQSDDIFNNTAPTPTSAFQSDDISNDLTSSQPPVTFDDNILDNVTSSQTPATFDSNTFDHQEQLNTSSLPINENILSNNSTNQQSEVKASYDMFVNESVSPLQAITKKREEEIAAKDAEERQKIDELRQQAKSDLERWYNDRQKQMEHKRQTMKNDENDLRSKALEKSTKDSCDWKKVIQLLEFNDGTQLSKSKRDLTRMKSCMLTARRIHDTKKSANSV